MSGFASQTEPWMIEVPCSKCGAEEGEKCSRPSGHSCFPHKPRLLRARQEGYGPDSDQEDAGLDDHRAGEDRRQTRLDL